MKKVAMMAVGAVGIGGAAVTGIQVADVGGVGASTKNIEVAQRVGEPLFLDMDPFLIPVIRGGRVRAHFMVVIKLEAIGTDQVSEIHAVRYRLADAFLRDLNAVLSVRGADGRTVRATTIKRRLQMICDRVVGDGVVRDVLIQNFSRRGVS